METCVVIGSPLLTPLYTPLHVTRPSTVLVLPRCHYTTETPPQMMTRHRVVPLTRVHFLMVQLTYYPTIPLLFLCSTPPKSAALISFLAPPAILSLPMPPLYPHLSSASASEGGSAPLVAALVSAPAPQASEPLPAIPHSSPPTSAT